MPSSCLFLIILAILQIYTHQDDIMKKLLNIFLFIIVVILAPASAYIYFSTKSAVDSMIDTVEPLANIKYQRFSNPFDGSISIHGVTVDDGSGTNVEIGSVELKLDSVFDYINFDEKITSGEIFPKLQLQINHIYVDLDTSKNDETAGAGEIILSYISALGCGDVKSINDEQLSELGYSGLDGSLNIDFEYDKLNSEATIELGITAHGIGSSSIRTSLSDIYSAEDIASFNKKFSNLELEVQDLGYNQRIIEYCTRKSNLETAAYLDLHMQELKKYLSNANVILSDEIYETYRAFFVDKATIIFRSKPESAANLQYINLYQTKDWANILGLSVYVNDKQVENFVFEWDKDIVLENLLAAQAGEKNPNNNDYSSAELPMRKKQIFQKHQPTPKHQEYFEISVNELDNYVNYQVKLETKLGKIYQGYVKSVSSSQVIVVIHLKGGKAEIPVGTNKIAKAFIVN